MRSYLGSDYQELRFAQVWFEMPAGPCKGSVRKLGMGLGMWVCGSACRWYF